MACVLIVDDDPTVQLIAAELLIMAGHRVLMAGDGVQALSMLEPGHGVDLVVMDMLMPNKDGLETILELKRRGAPPRIIAISSGGRSGPGELLRAAMAFGADAALVKPIDLRTFADTIASVLETPATRAYAD